MQTNKHQGYTKIINYLNPHSNTTVRVTSGPATPTPKQSTMISKMPSSWNSVWPGFLPKQSYRILSRKIHTIIHNLIIQWNWMSMQSCWHLKIPSIIYIYIYSRDYGIVLFVLFDRTKSSVLIQNGHENGRSYHPKNQSYHVKSEWLGSHLRFSASSAELIKSPDYICPHPPNMYIYKCIYKYSTISLYHENKNEEVHHY
jgi:hypothetical protein